MRRCLRWIAFRCYGSKFITLRQRRWLYRQSKLFACVTRPLLIKDAAVQPFIDLLNRPAGGDAYCGGPILVDLKRDWPLHHYRADVSIDRPLSEFVKWDQSPLLINSRLFWCGPLAFHFGHQVADFGSRVLLSSLDPRDGELLWIPWRTSVEWSDLKLWQQQLLNYLNPGKKPLRLANTPLSVRELVVWPQQARMRAAPTTIHLEALSWCERTIPSGSPTGAVYVSRSRFAPCTSRETLIGAFAAEAFLVELLQARGVHIIYPEELSLLEQLQIYRDSHTLILAEGSAQHGLELLGSHPEKNVILICRRPQKPGMDLPLRARFPKLNFVEAVEELWIEKGGVPWNGLASLDWTLVAPALNAVLCERLTKSDLRALKRAGSTQLDLLRQSVPMELSC